jgi:hypothetical protein
MIPTWGCPVDPLGTAPPAAAALPERCRGALAKVETRFGARGLTTCPVWYAKAPWVHRAVEAFSVLDKSVFTALYPNPSRRFLRAVLAVRDGVERRLTWDRENPPEKK